MGRDHPYHTYNSSYQYVIVLGIYSFSTDPASVISYRRVVLQAMVFNSNLSYFLLNAIIFLNLVHETQAAGIGIAAATGGAMSVLKGRVTFGSRPKDEGTEALIMGMLGGGAGLGVMVLAYFCIKGLYKRNSPKNPKAKLYLSKHPENSLQCPQGNENLIYFLIIM